MAATAWYYGMAGKGKELSVFVEEASKFAQHEYYKFLKQTSENSNLDTKKNHNTVIILYGTVQRAIK